MSPRIACEIRGVFLDWPDYPANTGMRPDDGRVRVALQECLHLIEVCWLRPFLGERNVDIVVNQHDQPNFGGEVEDTV